MADLCTLAEAKTHLNITTSTTDAELSAFVTVASDLVEAQANRVWRTTTYTEKHNGGTTDLVLLHSPVTSITSITDDGGTVASTDYDLIEANGLIHHEHGIFLGDRYDVTVVYVAGGAVPALAKQATLETLRHLWQTQRGSMGARNPLGGDEYAASSSFSLPNRVIELISRLSMTGGIG
jgi:hypothetical protein